MLEACEEECAILFNRTADSSAVLHARKRRFLTRIVVYERSESVARLNRLVTKEAEDVAAELVRARFCDDVDDAARCASEFRRVGVGRNLILLHGLLRDGQARGVDGVIGKIHAVNLHER